jgi:hypothetical protein
MMPKPNFKRYLPRTPNKKEFAMQSEERTILQRVVENFAMRGITTDEQVSVICISNGKTSTIEKIGDDGRTVMLDEYVVNEKRIRAGYSGRSQTVYLSLMSG